jgi:hypothetical protein
MIFGLNRVLRAFGTHSVDVFEWKQSDVKIRRLPKNPQWNTLAIPRQELRFSGWELAHSVIKADFLSLRSSLLPGIGFLFQIESLLDLGPSRNLRLLRGGSTFLSDFSQTSVSGRIGQGLSILFAHQKGYQFVAHLATEDAVINHNSNSDSDDRGRVADFLFDSKQHGRMILESKGTFHQPRNDPSRVKSVLKAALTEQVECWMGVISPPAKKGIVTYSCVREVGAPEPSALIFVDPEGEDGDHLLEFPPSLVLRRNYAAWLTAMGFHDSGRSLRGGDKRDLQEYVFSLVNVEGNTYAFPTFLPPFLGLRPSDDSWFGIEISALSAITEALEGDDRALLEYAGVATVPSDRGIASYHSIFPDGTFFGSLREEDIRAIEFRTFRL